MKKEAAKSNYWYFDRKTQVPDRLKKTVISPMHYGDTVEIHLNRGLKGEAVINGQRFAFKEKNVFFIPPRTLHSYTYTQGGLGPNDMIGAFHIHVDMLKPFIDIEKLLLADNRTLYSYSPNGHDFDRVWEIIRRILDDARPFCEKICDLIRLFETLTPQQIPTEDLLLRNHALLPLIDWVEHHYAQKLTIESAARHFGFSPCYFCKWIKAHTGITFNEFLNVVRISHADTYLINGCSVAETAQRCGYSDASHLVKVFKRFHGITPKAYASRPKTRDQSD